MRKREIKTFTCSRINFSGSGRLNFQKNLKSKQTQFSARFSSQFW